jgi:hypothetical protein
LKRWQKNNSRGTVFYDRSGAGAVYNQAKRLAIILPVLCLALTLLLSIAPAPASANTYGNYNYTVISEFFRTAQLNRIDNASGDVDIPGVVNGYTITSIGNTINSNIFVSSNEANNYTVDSVTIPSSVASIGEYAFFRCNYLNRVAIPDSVVSIGDNAFWDTNLNSVTIPHSVTSIGKSAFEGCDMLTSVSIGSNVTSIGNSAFEHCYELTSVYIPKSVSSIGDAAFGYCEKLAAIEVASDSNYYKSLGGILFDKSGTALILYPAGKTGATYQIPYGVASIGNFAFSYCTMLTDVNIPGSVTSIGVYAFTDCGLTSVEIPGSVTSIGEGAFIDCTSITNVSIGSGVTNIGSYAFRSCSFTCVDIPDSITSIGDDAFEYCSGLTGIDIPSSVTSIGSGAFRSCSSLNSARFYGNPPATFSSYVFDNTAPGFTIYYIAGKIGWTNPWHGYPTACMVPYSAQMVSSDIPATMTAGQPYIVNITVKNTGTNTWTAADSYKLGAVDGSDSFTTKTRQLLGSSDSITTGQSKTFTFTITAPPAAGSYITDWQMLREGVKWFGDKLTRSVTVSPPAYGAQITGSTIPAAMTAGQTYNVSITVKNTGSNTWTAADGYKLCAVGYSDPFTGARKLLGASDSIATGQSKTFSFTMTAPDEAGAYTSDWRMLREGVCWIGGTLTRSITVSPPAAINETESDKKPAGNAKETKRQRSRR